MDVFTLNLHLFVFHLGNRNPTNRVRMFNRLNVSALLCGCWSRARRDLLLPGAFSSFLSRIFDKSWMYSQSRALQTHYGMKRWRRGQKRDCETYVKWATLLAAIYTHTLFVGFSGDFENFFLIFPSLSFLLQHYHCYLMFSLMCIFCYSLQFYFLRLSNINKVGQYLLECFDRLTNRRVSKEIKNFLFFSRPHLHLDTFSNTLRETQPEWNYLGNRGQRKENASKD